MQNKHEKYKCVIPSVVGKKDLTWPRVKHGKYKGGATEPNREQRARFDKEQAQTKRDKDAEWQRQKCASAPEQKQHRQHP